MGKTSISYVDYSGSPWTNCTPVTSGCEKCFARTMALRRGWVKQWGAGEPRHAFKTYRERMLVLERWATRNLQCLVCKATGEDINANGFCSQCEVQAYPSEPRVLFDLGDWLDAEVSPRMLADALDVVRITPHLRHFWPTKRPELCERRVRSVYQLCALTGIHHGLSSWALHWLSGCAPLTLWPGVSISTQPDADKFITPLMRIPASKHWVSVEPMLGPVSLKKWLWDNGMDRMWPKKSGERIDFVVIGCESSGPNLGRLFLYNQYLPPSEQVDEARWWGFAIALARECREAGVPVHVKQIPLNGKLSHDPADGWPEDLVVREFLS